MSHAPIVVLSAPQGAGKSQNAMKLARRFGCTHVVDDWDGRTRLGPGSLALTSLSPAEIAKGRSRK